MECPEHLKPLFAEFVRINKEKYGDNWKEIISKQMTDDLMKSDLGKELQRRAKNANA